MSEGDSTRLYYVQARWYDPEQGRFMSEDPIGVMGGINLYAFAGGDYLNGTDPSGLDACGNANAPDDPEADGDGNTVQTGVPCDTPSPAGAGPLSSGFDDPAGHAQVRAGVKFAQSCSLK